MHDCGQLYSRLVVGDSLLRYACIHLYVYIYTVEKIIPDIYEITESHLFPHWQIIHGFSEWITAVHLL